MKLKVPDNVWLLHLPPNSSQLNPAENLFQYFEKNFIANRVFETTDVLTEAVLNGFNKLAKSTDRIKSIGKRSWATLTNQNKTRHENKTCSDGRRFPWTGIALCCDNVFPPLQLIRFKTNFAIFTVYFILKFKGGGVDCG